MKKKLSVILAICYLLMVLPNMLLATDNTPGTCFYFDGSNDYVTLPGNSAFNTLQFTVEFWVKMNNPGHWDGILDKGKANNTDWYFITGSNGETEGVKFGVRGGSSPTELSYSWNDTIWHHVAGVYDGTTAYLIVDGEIKASSICSYSVSNNNIFIGSRRGPGWHFQGKLDEVRFWNDARTLAEVRENLHLTLDGTEAGLVSYYQFNNGTGSTCTDAVSGFDGTLYNMDANDWVESTLIVGGGASHSQIVNTTGSYSFTNAGADLNFTAKTGTDTVVVTRITSSPNTEPSGSITVLDNQYWIIRKYGTGTFTSNLVLTTNENLGTDDENHPGKIRLFSRAISDRGEWDFQQSAIGVDAAINQVLFSDLSSFSQYLLIRAGNTEGASGTCLAFDGNDDHITLPAKPDFNPNVFTVEFWVKMDNPGEWDGIIDKGKASNTDWYFTTGSSGQTKGIIFGVRGGASPQELSYSWNDNQWHHVAGTYDGTTARLIIDGEVKASKTSTHNASTNNIYMGSRRGPAWYFGGELDEVRFWNEARSLEEIREHLHLTLDGDEAGLVSYYQFNEGSGTSCNDPLLGNNGDLNNMEANDWVESPLIIGHGTGASQIVSTTGAYNFSGTGIDLNFMAKTGTDTIVATRIDTAPNVLPDNPYYHFDSQYWFLDQYGSGSFTTNLTATINENLHAGNEANPSGITLYNRPATSNGDWAVLDSAQSVNAANNTLTVAGISTPGQFLSGRNNLARASGHISQDTSWSGIDTVQVTGDIFIDNGATLTIDPGIVVAFMGHYKMDVQGRLLAMGTESDSITFTTTNQGTGWNRIRFDATPNTNDTSKIVYCKLEYGKANNGGPESRGGALIIINYSKVLVTNSRFENNHADYVGGAVCCYDGANPRIYSSTFKSNTTNDSGAAIYCGQNANADIRSCHVSNNTAVSFGGGFFINNASPTIRSTLVCNNTAQYGAGIYLWTGQPQFLNMTIADNVGEGIFCYSNSDPSFKNSIVYGNTGVEIHLNDNDSDPDFSYCDIEGGTAAFGGTGAGPNYTGNFDDCIDADPQFVGSGNHPYDIPESSPCYNAGDSTTTITAAGNYDVMGDTRILNGYIDMGAYETLGPIHYAWGNISSDTHWKDVDTVKVLGDIFIEFMKTLTIDPGIVVEFQGHYKIDVKGCLLAIGKEADTITFTAANQSTGWNRIIFDDPSYANDTTKIIYCKLEYGKANTGYYDKCGGAMYIYDYPKILISNSIFSNNYASEYGGAMFLEKANIKIHKCIISNNTSQHDAIHLYNSSALISNCLIINNNGGYYAAGITIADNNPVILNTTLSNNDGYGVRCAYDADPIFRNSIIYDHPNYEVFVLGNDADPNFYYCKVNGVKLADYNDSYTGDLENCISADPQFVGSGKHPYKLVSGSPCMNAGDPSTNIGTVGAYDLGGEHRILADTIDIGAYETFAPVPTDPFPGHAINLDGIDDYIEVSDSISFAGDYTIELWFNTSASGKFQDIMAGTFNDLHGILLELTPSNYIRFLHRNPPGLTGGANVYSNSTYNTGEWHHLAAVKEGAETRLYINGLYEGSAIGANSFSSPLNIVFGRLIPESSSRQYNGKLDEVLIWDHARTLDQIRENMHLIPETNSAGLVNYWQFNKGSGKVVFEKKTNNNGTLRNMNSNVCWVESTFPAGRGHSATQVINSTGTFSFADASVQMDMTAKTGTDTLVLTRIDWYPNLPPQQPDHVLNAQYWVSQKYGDGTFNSNMEFSVQENITSLDLAHQDSIQLFTRSGNSGGQWSFDQGANSLSAVNETVEFTNISSTGQFIIGRKGFSGITIPDDTLDFDTVLIKYPETKQLIVYNYNHETLNINSISISNEDFSFEITNDNISPNDSIILSITFSPTEENDYVDTLTINSNDTNDPHYNIILRGNGNKRRLINTLDLPLQGSLISFDDTPFNWYRVTPTFIDLDGDKLIDLIMGEASGKLRYYEQDSVNSTSFHLLTDFFNSIDDESYSAPTFTDLDGDSLLDMVIGSGEGTLFHYEQDSIHSLSFTKDTTTFFKTLDVGWCAHPTFVDLDGDDLLDFILGASGDHLIHYEQDSVNSTAFTLITNNFSNITAGLYNKPTFTDLDGDGLLDLLVGQWESTIRHYEQNFHNSNSFSLVTSSFWSINIPDGDPSPAFTDLDDDGYLDLFVGGQHRIEQWEQKKREEFSIGPVLLGDTVAEKYFLKCPDLLSDMIIECPDGYSVSLSENSGFAQNITISPVDGKILDTIFVRFVPVSVQAYNGEIVHSSQRVQTRIIEVSGLGFENEVGEIECTRGTALDFDGSNDYVDVSQHDYLPIYNNGTNNAYSLTMWVKGSAQADKRVFSEGSSSSTKPLFTIGSTSNGEVLLHIRDDSNTALLNASSSNKAFDNTWHHLAWVDDNGNAKLYIDGILDATDFSYTRGVLTLDQTSIGAVLRGSPSHHFLGQIDEMSLWNIALAPEELRANMYRTLSGDESGLISYWQFNDSTWVLLTEAINANTGILRNMEETDWVASTAPVPFESDADGNWADSTLWLSGQGYPATTWARAKVNSDLILNQNLEIMELQVESGKSLTLPVGTGLTITDTITNQAGPSGIVLQVDATGQATIIQPVDSVDATVQRYLTQSDYHYIAAPVSNQSISTEFVDASSNPLPATVDFYKFDEPANLWRNIKDGSGNLNGDFETQFVVGRGYAYANSSAIYTKEFEGHLNFEDLSVSLTKQGSPTNNGWNLVGNPFPANLAANTTADATNNFLSNNASALDNNHEAIYFYNGNDYVAVNQASAESYIAPTQGFFVKAAADGEELDFKAADQKHAAATFYKNGSTVSRFKIGISNPQGDENEILLAFIAGKSKGLDPGYDAQKLKGNYNLTLYTLLVDDDENDYAIQTLPQVDNQQVKLGVDAGQSGLYEFDNIEMENLNYSTIFLEDKTENLWVNLNLNPSYQFVLQQAGSFEDRFVLHFGGIITDIEEASDTEMPFTILCDGAHIFLQNLSDELMSGTFHIHNLTGQVLDIDQVNVDAHSREVHTPSLAAGLYLVSFRSGDRVFTQKVVLSK